MAKKKPPQTQGDTDMPATAESDVRKGSRHKPRKMLAMGSRLYGLLKELARRNKRPVTWEGRIAICKALVAAGMITEEESERMTQDDPEDEQE